MSVLHFLEWSGGPEYPSSPSYYDNMERDESKEERLSPGFFARDYWEVERGFLNQRYFIVSKGSLDPPEQGPDYFIKRSRESGCAYANWGVIPFCYVRNTGRKKRFPPPRRAPPLTEVAEEGSLQMNVWMVLEVTLGGESSWTRRTRVRFLFRMSFSPVEMLRCLLRLLLWANFLPHSTQENGFSPEWMRLCIFRKWFKENFAGHSGQQKGFSPVWVLPCLTRYYLLAKALPHSSLV